MTTNSPYPLSSAQHSASLAAFGNESYLLAVDDVLREAADWFMARDGATYVVDALCQRRLTGEWPS